MAKKEMCEKCGVAEAEYLVDDLSNEFDDWAEISVCENCMAEEEGWEKCEDCNEYFCVCED